MANLSDKDRETLREQAQILRTAPGSDSDGFAGQVLAGLAHLYSSIDNEDLREYAQWLKFSLTYHIVTYGDSKALQATDSAAIRRLPEVMTQMSEHDKQQLIGYVEDYYGGPKPQAPTPTQHWLLLLASWLTTQPVMPKRLTYRVIWNGVDNFDIVRAA